MHSGTSLWINRRFARLWAAQSISAVGSRISRTALPVLAVLQVEAAPIEVGILSALSVAPGALVALLIAGSIDRRAKRDLLIASDLFRALVVLSVPIAAYWARLSMEQLYVVAALLSAGTALFQIADNTYLPELVADEQIVAANARIEGSEAIAEISGPGLGGLLIEWITAPLAMVVDALSYLCSAALLIGLPSQEPDVPKTRQGLWSDISAGMRSCLDHSAIRPMFFAHAWLQFVNGFFFSLYMIFGLKTLSLGAGELGIIISFGGVGALLGAYLAPRIQHRLGIKHSLILCLSLAQLGDFLIPMAGGSTTMIWFVLVTQQIVGDGFSVAYSIQAISLRQRLVDRAVLGRANASFQVLSSSLVPTGAIMGGLLAEAVGVRTGLWIGMGVGLLTPLWLMRMPKTVGRELVSVGDQQSKA